MRFIILGEPQAKQRHRMVGKCAYNPQKHEEMGVRSNILFQLTQGRDSKDQSIVEQINAIGNASHFKVYMEFHCKPPQSDLWGTKCSNSKTDIDNYCKFVLDCCNSILYSDDHKIVDLHAIKCYSPIQKTIIDIFPMDPADISKAELRTLNEFTPDDMREFLSDISILSQYSVEQLDEFNRAEIDEWTHEVAMLQYNFACKWVQKLSKIAKK